MEQAIFKSNKISRVKSIVCISILMVALLFLVCPVETFALEGESTISADSSPEIQNEVPADEDEVFADVEETSTDESEVPADEEETSTDESKTPADESEVSANENEAPPEKDEVPADENEPFVDEEEIPADENEVSVSVQEMINAAAKENIAGSTIYLDGGIYNEDLQIDALTDSGCNGLQLIASGNGGTPVINGQVTMNGLVGFTMQGIQVNGTITVQDSCDVTIQGTTADDTLQVNLYGTVNNITVDGAGGNDNILLTGSAHESSAEDTAPPGVSPSNPGTDPPQTEEPKKPAVTVNGGSGDDQLTVDFGQGNPIPQNGLSYDGGDDYDVITLQGGSFQSSEYQAINAHAGTIKLDDTLICYTNIEPIEDKTVTDQITFKGTENSDTVTIADGPLVEGNATITIDSPDFESITFYNHAKVIFDGLTGDDIITFNLSKPSTGLTSLMIVGGAGRDTIQNLGNSVLLAGIDLSLQAEKITITDGEIQGKNISLIAETIAGSSNPFADVENKIELNGTTITATGDLLIRATSKQELPLLS
ncbi:MAG: hypothetical protein PHV03_09860, partial [Desulfitobacteriaceae bacterium]|nr:hypothetical protein [Desulfitobacteriaceae bacterium]